LQTKEEASQPSGLERDHQIGVLSLTVLPYLETTRIAAVAPGVAGTSRSIRPRLLMNTRAKGAYRAFYCVCQIELVGAYLGKC
tara:strand:+ start:2910 stop:3158 length:249 start_codon:yes stop_codon:yes gene_type:complete